MAEQYDTLNIPLVEILLKRENDLERQIAIASIFRPVDVLKKGFEPKVNRSVKEYWNKLKLKKNELIMAGNDACFISRSLIDSKTFYDWYEHDKPNWEGRDYVDDALVKLRAYRHSRVCVIDIQDDLNKMVGGLCMN